MLTSQGRQEVKDKLPKMEKANLTLWIITSTKRATVLLKSLKRWPKTNCVNKTSTTVTATSAKLCSSKTKTSPRSKLPFCVQGAEIARMCSAWGSWTHPKMNGTVRIAITEPLGRDRQGTQLRNMLTDLLCFKSNLKVYKIIFCINLLSN